MDARIPWKPFTADKISGGLFAELPASRLHPEGGCKAAVLRGLSSQQRVFATMYGEHPSLGSVSDVYAVYLSYSCNVAVSSFMLVKIPDESFVGYRLNILATL
jgi:hypothetical protein